jgi:hypothetical protein
MGIGITGLGNAYPVEVEPKEREVPISAFRIQKDMVDQLPFCVGAPAKSREWV